MKILNVKPAERRSAWSRLAVAAGGLLLHVMLLLSIFDIYFRSPIVQSVSPQTPHHEPLARRIVLFSIDGMRAESFLEHNQTPFLRSIAQKRGIWGISHTRVPTESRPGHIAMIAGFYEDPSAVTRGWKKNPVDFDSVFNQSRYTWSFGADDILRIFSKDENDDHIFLFAYNTQDQTFSTDKNTTLLDKWVFDRVKKFFLDATRDVELFKKLNSDQIVIFLHILGVDIAGHTHKPNSVEFKTNMKYVDNGIQKVEKLLEEFYGRDGQTTYIMTSDHGMTNWGSHGAGSKHETETPYVIWGAGVADFTSESDQGFLFGLPRNRRKDITKADFAPLMSTIISIPVPVNSIGRLPTGLLNMTLETKARALHCNSLQLAEQYNTLRRQVEQDALPALYAPYQPFTDAKYQEILSNAQMHLANQEYNELIILTEDIMELSLSGLSYYRNYYQRILLLCVSLCFFGWLCFLLTILMEQHMKINYGIKIMATRKNIFFQTQTWINVLFAIIAIVLTILICVQRLPAQYYAYALVPALLWRRVLLAARAWGAALRDAGARLLLQVPCYVAGTVAIVWSFSERWWLSIPLLGMAAWPFVSPQCRQAAGRTLLGGWAVSCAMLGLFSFLPVVGKNVRIELVFSVGLAWLTVMWYFCYYMLLPLVRSGREAKKGVYVIILQAVVLVLALHNIYVQNKRFTEKTPVIKEYQVLAWIIAGTSMTLPILSSGRQVCRLLSIYSGLVTLYLLLSVAHEGLFLLALVLNQVCWMLIEFRMTHSKNKKISDLMFFGSEAGLQSAQGLPSVERSLTAQDFRRAFFVTLYIFVCFFGTGNIASINSYEVRWVTCFITTNSPFTIVALIVCKTMVPILMVACSFRAMNIITKTPMGYLIVIVLLFSNMMGVQFLFLVRNTGSWLEIGSSISQYVISQVIILLILVLQIVAKVLTEEIITSRRSSELFEKLSLKTKSYLHTSDSKQTSHRPSEAPTDVSPQGNASSSAVVPSMGDCKTIN